MSPSSVIVKSGVRCLLFVFPRRKIGGTFGAEMVLERQVFDVRVVAQRGEVYFVEHERRVRRGRMGRLHDHRGDQCAVPASDRLAAMAVAGTLARVAQAN